MTCLGVVTAAGVTIIGVASPVLAATDGGHVERRGHLGDLPGLDPIIPGRWGGAPADESDPSSTVDWSLALDGFMTYDDPGDLESGGGDVQVTRGAAEFRLDATPLGEIEWSVSGGYEHSDYDFTTGATPLIGGSSILVESVRAFDLSWDGSLRVDEHWTIFGGFGASIAGATGADFSDMVNFGGRIGAGYRVSDDLALGLGVFVREDFAEGVEVLPLFLVDWRLNDDLAFALEGPQAELVWSASESLRLSAFAAFEIRAYALADDGIVPNGVFNDERVVVGVGADWRVASDVRLRGRIGAIVSQEFDVENANGEEVITAETDGTGLTASIGLSIRF